MATNAIIQAALSAAMSSGLSWRDKAVLLRAAVDNAIVADDGTIALPWTQTGANGVNLTRLSLKEAIDMAVRFESLDTGGIVGQYVEFRE